jgi:RNA polymerase sigma factor (sigma-70 family)
MRRLLTVRASPERLFESLYRRHVRDVYRYAFALLASPADAEDVTQATFLNAYRAIERGERPRQPEHWLRAIAHNLCRQQFRQAARRARQVALDGDVEELVAEEQSPSVEDLVRALKYLPFSQRSALVLREFEGRSLQDIAEILEISPSAVETLLFRARRCVREQLEEGLSCLEAEQAISSQLDGVLPRRERGALRAHLRRCDQCASLARRLRAQRGAMRSLAVLPLPASLAWSSPWSAGVATGTVTGAAAVATAGGSSLIGSIVAKIAVTAAAATAVGGIGYEAISGDALSSGGSGRPAARGAQHVHATGSSSHIARASTPLLVATGPSPHIARASARHPSRLSARKANQPPGASGRAARAPRGHGASARRHSVKAGGHVHGKRRPEVVRGTTVSAKHRDTGTVSKKTKPDGHSGAGSPARTRHRPSGKHSSRGKNAITPARAKHGPANRSRRKF